MLECNRGYSNDGEMGWEDLKIKQQICMIRFCNRLLKMNNSRLAKIIFKWEYNLKLKKLE